MHATTEFTSHELVDPAILYFGTPVCLLGTRNADGSDNLAPMSSVFWLGSTAVLGMGVRSRTCINLLREQECVLNLPSSDMVGAVDRLALTTGSHPVPQGKADRGYHWVADKFAASGLTPAPATLVSAPRVQECPVNLEARVVSHRGLGGLPVDAAEAVVFDVEVTAVHVHRDIRLAGTRNRIDPDRWRPLIMSFQQFYELGPRLRTSRLASIDEELYRCGAVGGGDRRARLGPDSAGGRPSGRVDSTRGEGASAAIPDGPPAGQRISSLDSPTGLAAVGGGRTQQCRRSPTEIRSQPDRGLTT